MVRYILVIKWSGEKAAFISRLVFSERMQTPDGLFLAREGGQGQDSAFCA
ncbi:MAG: hypothetical protein PVH77_10230 [Phycisphaerales bacterium]